MAFATSHVCSENLTCFFSGKNNYLFLQILCQKIDKIVDVFWFEVVIILLCLVFYPLLQKMKHMFLYRLTVRAIEVVQYVLHLILHLALELRTQVTEN